MLSGLGEKGQEGRECPLLGLECDSGGEGGRKGRSSSGGVAGALCVVQ